MYSYQKKMLATTEKAEANWRKKEYQEVEGRRAPVSHVLFYGCNKKCGRIQHFQL